MRKQMPTVVLLCIVCLCVLVLGARHSLRLLRARWGHSEYLLVADSSYGDETRIYVEIGSIQVHDDHISVWTKNVWGKERLKLIRTNPAWIENHHDLIKYAFNLRGDRYLELEVILCKRDGNEIDSIHGSFDDAMTEAVATAPWVMAVRDFVFERGI